MAVQVAELLKAQAVPLSEAEVEMLRNLEWHLDLKLDTFEGYKRANPQFFQD